MELAEAASPRLKLFEHVTRIVFVATLSVEICEKLVPKMFPNYMNTPDFAYVPQVALKRVRGNCATWKYRTILNVKVCIGLV